LSDYHWRRNCNRNHEEGIPAKPCAYNNIVHGSKEVATLRLGLQDPQSPWNLLAGLEEPLLSQILDFTEHRVLPCSCCQSKIVVLCCRVGHTVRREKNPDQKNRSTEEEKDDSLNECIEGVPYRFVKNFLCFLPHRSIPS